MSEQREQQQQQEAGIRCSRCGCRECRVIYTRAGAMQTTARRRECRHCGKRFTTRERIVG